MLTIRQRQMAALREYMRASFEDDLAKFIQGAYPANFSDPEAARKLAREGIPKAVAYGIDTERDIAAFVCLMAEFGPEFYKSPSINPALTDTDTPGEAKVSMIKLLLSRGQA